MAICYILYSETLKKFYIGHTTEPIEERLRKHLSDHKGFTAKAKDWKVIFQEIFDTKEQAYKRELQIKSWKSTKRIHEMMERHSASGSAHPDL